MCTRGSCVRTLFPQIAVGQICKFLKVGYLVARRRVCFRVRLATLFTSKIGRLRIWILLKSLWWPHRKHPKDSSPSCSSGFGFCLMVWSIHIEFQYIVTGWRSRMEGKSLWSASHWCRRQLLHCVPKMYLSRMWKTDRAATQGVGECCCSYRLRVVLPDETIVPLQIFMDRCGNS